MSAKVAVAMSVYKSDSQEFLTMSLESILTQNYENIDIYIEVDGPVSTELSKTILKYSDNQKVYIEFHDENRGLATRLNNIIEKCLSKGDYTYLARMDADDISLPHRIQTQVDFLNHNEKVAVVGSDIIEVDSKGNDLFYKKMLTSHNDIKNMVIKKCPFNHPTVMFRMNIFNDKKIRYKERLKNTQDYYLWIDLLYYGFIFANINQPLLKFRVDENFHSRRGVDKAINDLKSRIYAFKMLDVNNTSNFIHTLALFFLRLSPSFIKKFAYNFLR
ncbi:glycosyltransferase [Photobacterium sp. ZSDE20]|uniref:Glycosyltransferase n=1 Tax=Photobacterium pectinilyticum TaxID=2906793 RepID=A0ABT1N5L0_9GAMM|nr:glycosyltransferase [Photobacterium sp. ZSDE20]MCQ1060028.1 glycosyltransferase [Photobacterium sp. ZSDE20]MDD1826949.1 glycosyltransferase [Photobacterium sp. ZSDE20]